MRRCVLLASLALASCTGGLYTQYGNAFPCDFTQPPGTRDQACPSGWVCGARDVCEQFFNEGLPVDPVPTLPDFTQARRLYPTQLLYPIQFVSPDPLVPGQVLAVDQDGGFFIASSQSVQQFSPVGPTSRPPPLAATYGVAILGGQLFFHGAFEPLGDVLWMSPLGGGSTLSTLADVDGGAHVVTGIIRVGARLFNVSDGGQGTTSAAWVLRSRQPIPDGGNGRFPGQVASDGSNTAEFDPFWVTQDDAGTVDETAQLNFQDVRMATRARLDPGGLSSQNLAPMVITSDGFYLLNRGSGPPSWTRLNPGDLALDSEVAEPIQTLIARHSQDATLWAVSPNYANQRSTVLSTWTAIPASPVARMERLWSDCTPCPSGQNVRVTSPQTAGSPSVEVFCVEPGSGGFSLESVIGSSVISPSGRCTVESLQPTIDLYEITQYVVDGGELDGGKVGALAVDLTVGDTLTFGGQHGQIWQGSALDSLTPLFLDRVPLAAGTFDGGLIALTNNFLAQETPPGMAATTLAAMTGQQVETTVNLAAAARGLDGWFVLSSGAVAYLNGTPDIISGNPVNELYFGPQLLSPAGTPQTGPFIAESNRNHDQLVVSAGDSLYDYTLISDPTLLPQAPGQDSLNPKLTPQPSSPIRSMVVDQTLSPDPTADPNNANRLLVGYMLTSSSVYQFALQGTPLQIATPLNVGAGEPVKGVWMQSSTSTNGRVGFRDGSIYTLPGGFPFVEPLPSADGGPARALDFETLNNYPVVLAESGLYVATLPDAGTTGSYPVLTWTPIGQELPELTPPLSSGLLFTQNNGSSSNLYLFGKWGRVYQLADAGNQ